MSSRRGCLTESGRVPVSLEVWGRLRRESLERLVVSEARRRCR